MKLILHKTDGSSKGIKLGENFQVFFLEHKRNGEFSINQSIYRNVESFRFFSGNDFSDSRERPLVKAE